MLQQCNNNCLLKRLNKNQDLDALRIRPLKPVILEEGRETAELNFGKIKAPSMKPRSSLKQKLKHYYGAVGAVSWKKPCDRMKYNEKARDINKP